MRRGWYLLLLLPFVATLVPPFYARENPMAGPWPFFYWWQFAWIVLTALILALVYRLTTRRDRASAGTDGPEDRAPDDRSPGDRAPDDRGPR